MAFGLHEAGAAFQWQTQRVVGFQGEYTACLSCCDLCLTGRLCQVSAANSITQGGQIPSRHSSASASKRQYQIPEISIRQCPQDLQNVSEEPKPTGTTFGSGQLLQRIGANIFLKNSTTGRTSKANSTWGIENKCQMVASLLCTLGNVVLNRFWKHPNLLSMKLKKSLWGCSTTGELGRDTLSTTPEKGSSFWVHISGFSLTLSHWFINEGNDNSRLQKWL